MATVEGLERVMEELHGYKLQPHERHLYIAGPMTGYPDSNYPAFRMAKYDIESRLGLTAHDPSENGGFGSTMSYEDYLRAGLKQLLNCFGVAVLPGWEWSKGAQMEVRIALDLKMPIAPLATWLEGAL